MEMATTMRVKYSSIDVTLEMVKASFTVRTSRRSLITSTMASGATMFVKGKVIVTITTKSSMWVTGRPINGQDKENSSAENRIDIKVHGRTTCVMVKGL